MRDTMLAVSGRLDTTPAKASPVTARGEGNARFRPRGPFGNVGDSSATDAHRTVYLPIVRDGLPEILTLFDFPDPSLIIGERATTTVPAQSLFLMNNPFVISQSENLADSLLSSSDDDTGKLTAPMSFAIRGSLRRRSWRMRRSSWKRIARENRAAHRGQRVSGVVRQCGVFTAVKTRKKRQKNFNHRDTETQRRKRRNQSEKQEEIYLYI